MATSARSDENNSSIQQPTPTSSATTKTEWLSLQCRPCQNRGAESNARAFVMGPTPLSVVVCSNRLPAGSVEEMEQILTHELTHIYDVRHLKLNLLDCHSLAYSEVRAAREAECSPSQSQSSNSNWIFGTTQSPYEQQQQCVQQKAVTATRNLFPHQAQACLDAALQAGALQDLRPFVDATSTAPTASSPTTNTSNDNHNHHNISGGGETATGRNTNKEFQQQQKPTPRQ